MTALHNLIPWEQFCRKSMIHPEKGFYGCVDKDGDWFDSADSMSIAIHWCCYYCGEYDFSKEEEIVWMNTIGMEKGFSIIHSSILEKMYYHGLIK